MLIFLAYLTWATLLTEPPLIVKIYTDLDACLVEAGHQNKANLFGPPEKKFVCLMPMGET